MISLRNTIQSDLEIFFQNQLDKEANQMAAFTPKDPTDKKAYMEKWTKILEGKKIPMNTIIFNDEIAGSILSYEIEGDAQVSYWIGRSFWGQGIASKALCLFLEAFNMRPLFGRVAFDNFGSQKVLEKCGFTKVGQELFFANARGKEIEEFIYKIGYNTLETN